MDGITKKELAQLYYLNKEINSEKKRLAELEHASVNNKICIEGITYFRGSREAEKIDEKIKIIKAAIGAKIELSVAEYNKLNNFIAGVDDVLTRQVLMLRYIGCCSWKAVAKQVGGGNTSESVRKIHDRFLQKK